MVRIYIETEKTDTGARYGAVMEVIIKDAPVTRALHADVEGSEEMAVLAAVLRALGRMTKKTQIEIHVPEEYKHLADLQELDRLRTDGFWKGMRRARHYKILEEIWKKKQGHALEFVKGHDPYKRWILSNLIDQT